jgi:hypothetical protein
LWPPAGDNFLGWIKTCIRNLRFAIVNKIRHRKNPLESMVLRGMAGTVPGLASALLKPAQANAPSRGAGAMTKQPSK